MEGMAPADSEMPSFCDFFGRSSDMISLSPIIFKNMAHVRSNSHFVFVIVFVFVCVCVFIITGASVYSTCHKLSENVWVVWFKTS